MVMMVNGDEDDADDDDEEDDDDGWLIGGFDSGKPHTGHKPFGPLQIEAML